MTAPKRVAAQLDGAGATPPSAGGRRKAAAR
jgi:hypothetical protein